MAGASAPSAVGSKAAPISLAFFSRRSAVYWRPILTIHARYCPWRQLVPSLCQYYGWYFWNRDPKLRRRLGWLLRPLARGFHWLTGRTG